MNRAMQLVHETNVEKDQQVTLHFVTVKQKYDDNGVHKFLDTFTRNYDNMTTAASVFKAWWDFMLQKSEDAMELTSENSGDDFRGQVRFVEGSDNGMFWSDTLVSVSYKNKTSMFCTELLPMTKDEFLAYVDANFYKNVFEELKKKMPSVLYRNPLA